MKIPENLDKYFRTQYPMHYTEINKNIIETHELVYSQKLYDFKNRYSFKNGGFECEYYFCKRCLNEVIEIIWVSIEWKPLSCNDIVIKKLLE